jgi:hypothetical protein
MDDRDLGSDPRSDIGRLLEAAAAGRRPVGGNHDPLDPARAPETVIRSVSVHLTAS